MCDGDRSVTPPRILPRALLGVPRRGGVCVGVKAARTTSDMSAAVLCRMHKCVCVCACACAVVHERGNTFGSFFFFSFYMIAKLCGLARAS